MPGPIYKSENPEEVTRNKPSDYQEELNFYQEAMELEVAKNEDPLLSFANLLMAQMLMEDPTKAPLRQTKENGKTIYYEAKESVVVSGLASKTYHDPYFQLWAADKSVDDLMQMAKEPEKALKEFQQEVRKSEKHYSDLGKRGAEAKVAGSVSGAEKEAKSFYEAMQATGTGRNWLGVKRKSNSREYDAMMEAVGKAVSEGSKYDTPEERAQNLAQNLALAVAATKKYLADKKTVRKTEDGQIRWENSMRFLHSAMPAEEFKAYCDEVNRARGGKDQISPEMFAPPRTAERTVEAVQQDMRDKGQITLQDAAKVAAAYDLNIARDNDKKYKLNPETFKNREIDPIRLAEHAEDIAKNKEFQTWFRDQGKDVLNADMTKGHDGLGARIGHWKYPRPQDVELTNQLKAQRDAEMARENQAKKERMALYDKLQKEQPEVFKELDNEHKEIKGLKKTDPEAYQRRKNEYYEKLNGLIAEDKKRQADKDKQKEEPKGPQKQEQKQKEKPQGPVIG